jgi:hypothetical protein
MPLRMISPLFKPRGATGGRTLAPESLLDLQGNSGMHFSESNTMGDAWLFELTHNTTQPCPSSRSQMVHSYEWMHGHIHKRSPTGAGGEFQSFCQSVCRTGKRSTRSRLWNRWSWRKKSHGMSLHRHAMA